MKLSKLTLAAIAATGFCSAFAQTAKVNLSNVSQTQIGPGNYQTSIIGNATGAGSSTKVNVNGLTQDQKGQSNIQYLSVGTAKNSGSTNVNVTNLKQTQDASNATQGAWIGYGYGPGGNSDVTVGNLTQDQKGSSNLQALYMGAAEYGSAKVGASNVHQIQNSYSSSQNAYLGNYWASGGAGSTDLIIQTLSQNQQYGSRNSQALGMANAQYGGNAIVNATDTDQTQLATNSTQIGWIGNAFGPRARSDVTTYTLKQSQSGQNNKQELYLGSSWDGRASNGNDGGSAKVSASSVTQYQHGNNDVQYAAIGDAMGASSKSDVTVVHLWQEQSSNNNSQDLMIGNASNGGSTTVTVSNVTQVQAGVFNHQLLEVGDVQ